MLFTDIIRRKRDGAALSAEDIETFVHGLANESLPAEQVAALGMAIFLKSMNFEEAAHLTRAMTASGRTLDWQALGVDGPVVDKHSTGGIGDKVSFLLAPAAAACGCMVPMISGRGLGHTGGTLDKAESIPGYRATPDLETLIQVVRQIGCAIVGQTGELAPADRRFYAIRDITGTVESTPLITASILSKKIAAGNRGLAMDVKVGTGAFMTTLDDARGLAESIIGTARAADLRSSALITDMNQPLGTTVGNALEMREVVAYLKGEHRDARLHEVVIALVAEMLCLAGVEADRDRARDRAMEAMDSGQAAEIFGRMVAALGGPTDFLERSDVHLPSAPVVRPVFAGKGGFLSGVDGRGVGNAVIVLGGGRRRTQDELDHSVGFSDFAPIGAELDGARPLAFVHAADERDAERAARALQDAVVTTPAAPSPTPVIHERLTGD